MSILNTVVHISAVAACTSFAFLVFNGSLFSYHPLFMMVSYLLIMSEGIMTSVGFRGSDGEERISGIRNHMRVQIVAVVCAVVGFTAIVANKVCVRMYCEIVKYGR